MKKLLTICLALVMLFGISAGAWAADEISGLSIKTTQNGTLTENQLSSTPLKITNNTITITGNIPASTSKPSGAGDEITYYISVDPVGLEPSNPAKSSFEIKTTASALKDYPGGTITIKLHKRTVTYDASGAEEKTVEETLTSATKNLSFSIAGTLEVDSVKVFCGSDVSSNYATASGDNFVYKVPASCAASHKLTVTPEVPSGITVSPASATVDCSQSSTYSSPLSFTVSNGAGESKTVNVSFTKGDGTATVSSAAIKNGSTSLDSASPSGNTISLAIANSVSSSAELTVQLSPSKTGATIKSVTSSTTGAAVKNAGVGSTSFTATIPATAGTYDFALTMVAEDGVSTQNYTVKITRNSTGTTAALNSVTVTSGTSASSTGTSVGSTSSPSTALEYSVSSSHGYVKVAWTKPTGATITGIVYSGCTKSAEDISNNNTVVAYSTTSTSNATVKITVRSEDGTKTQTYTITLTRNTSSDTKISNLYVKDRITTSTSSSYLYDMDYDFSSSRTTYSVTVPSGTSELYVYFTPASSGATITTPSSARSVDTSKYSSNGYYKFNLYTGSSATTSNNTFAIKLTRGSSSTTYTFKVTQEADVNSNASLSSLIASKSSSSSSSSNRYTLSPSFKYNILEYSVGVPTGTSDVYLHLTPEKSSSTLTVSNATKVSGNIYRVSMGSAKTKTCNITVTYNSSTKETYKVTVNVGDVNALLSSIYVSSSQSTSTSYRYTLYPTFSESVKDYFVPIPNESSSTLDFYVQATLKNSSDDLYVDGSKSTTSSGSWLSRSVSPGNTRNIEFEVEDEDGNTSTYNVDVYYAPRNADNVATLRDLYLQTSSSSSSSVDISPSFANSTTSYTATVANTVESIRVYPETTDSNAMVLVDNKLMTGSYETVDLSEGRNTITITVYAENASTKKSYTITVTRGTTTTTTTSSDSALSGLELRTATAQLPISLVPGFNKDTLTYKANVPGDVAAINFRATTSDSGATIKILGSTERSGSWSSNYTLSGGINDFTIAVTSASGSTTNYKITIEKGLTVQVSNQNLIVDGNGFDCAAYNVNGNNYFKLRDIAYAVRGTSKKFNVVYNDYTRIVAMTSGVDYTVIGGEMIMPSRYNKVVMSNQGMTVDGRSRSLGAYNIDGNNYFMLREIAEIFNFGVTYNENSRTVEIDTTTGYTYED